jgi:hypothetical protein
LTYQPFGDFTGTPEDCEIAERFWSEVVRGIEGSIGEEHWQHWIIKAFSNGTPFPEQWNPVFEARSGRRQGGTGKDRAFRIIQHPSESRPSQVESVGAWLEQYGDEWDDGMPDEELFLSLELTPLSLERARLLLTAWMNPQTSYADMEELLQSQAP